MSTNDAQLFEVDIEALHKAAVSILNRYRFDSYQELVLAGYVNGQMDIYKGENFPASNITEPGGIADLLDEMWERKTLLVEDMMYRRMFILICIQTLIVKSWDDENDITPEYIASMGVKL